MPDHMLSYKQCTVLVFAGKLMWLSVLLQHKQKKLVHCFQGMEITCFHVTQENVQQSLCGWILAVRVGKLLFIGAIFENGINYRQIDLGSFFNGHENTSAHVLLGTISGLD